jgi:hypothetical protein
MDPPPVPSGPTQADRLPEFRHIIIPPIKRLSNANDIYHWGSCIQISLCARNLSDLTSSTVPRPDENHPMYNNWAKWSRFVCKWLVQNVDENFTSYYKKDQTRLEFADTTYQVIQSLDMNQKKSSEVSSITTELLKLWNMRRCQFRGVDQYVDAWRDQVIICQRLTVGFSYLSATKIMLHEVEWDLPVLATFIDLQLQEYDNVDQMIYNQFNSIVRGIIGAVQKDNWRPL